MHHLLWGLLLLLGIAIGAPPQIISSTYQVKDTELLGIQYKYGMFDIEFDQDIYYPENWACPCQNTPTAQCPTSRIRPAIDETGFEITDLTSQYDQWIVMNATEGENQWFKFYLDPAQFPNSCPIVRVYVQNIYGDTGLLIANAFIPDARNYQWSKVPWHRDNMWICPIETEWRWGWWYFSTYQRPPTSAFPQFQVRWSTLDVPTCTNTSRVGPTPAVDDNWVSLAEDEPHYGSVNISWQYARFYVNSTCTDFSVQVRQADLTQLGDLDIYMSRFDPIPTLDTTYEWASQIDGIDEITVYGICSPDGTVPWPIYIGWYSWLGDSCDFILVASTKNMGVRKLLSDDQPQQITRHSMGGFLMDCGNEETFLNFFPSFDECNDPISEFSCSSPMCMTAPTLNPYPMLIHNKAIPSMDYLATLPWPRYVTNSENVRRKMVVTLLLSTSSYPDLYRTYVQQSDISQCVLKWNNIYTNEDGEPLVGTVTFTKKELTCDASALAAQEAIFKQSISNMANTTNLEALQIQEFYLQNLLFSDVVHGCTDLLGDYVSRSIEENYTVSGQKSCSKIYKSVAYEADPCCTDYQAYYACCQGKDRVYSIFLPEETITNVTHVEATCSSITCSSRTLTSYARTLSDQNPLTGNTCLEAFKSSASPQVIEDQTAFIRTCRRTLLGDDISLAGISCETDTDCFYGRTCNNKTKKCNHDDDTVLECFIESLDPTIAQILVLDIWNLPTQATPEVLRSEMKNRFFVNACTGFESILYRPHYTSFQELATCVDACAGHEPRCFEITDCEVIPECSFLGDSSTVCWRHWGYYIPPDPQACDDQFQCNWMDCGTSDNATCTADCLNITDVCLSCLDSTCIAVTGTDSNTCTTGCRVGDTTTVATEAQCDTMGECSLACGGCSEAACEALGTCVGLSDYQAYLAGASKTNGTCIQKFIVGFYGDVISCGEGQTALIQGCASDITYDECIEGGFIWLTQPTGTDEVHFQVTTPQTSLLPNVFLLCWASVKRILLPLPKAHRLGSCQRPG